MATELGSPAMGNVTGPLPWKGVKSGEPEWKKCLALNTLKEVGKPEAGILIRFIINIYKIILFLKWCIFIKLLYLKNKYIFEITILNLIFIKDIYV